MNENNFRMMRKKLNLKQKELAALSGVSPQIVSIHELKGVKTMRVARRYAEVLKCDPKELLD
jgi:DNA-binding XRE family transcriptional regulator